MVSVHCKSVIGHPWINSHLCSMQAAPCRWRHSKDRKITIVYSILLSVKYPAPFRKSDYMLPSLSGGISNKKEHWHAGEFKTQLAVQQHREQRGQSSTIILQGKWSARKWCWIPCAVYVLLLKHLGHQAYKSIQISRRTHKEKLFPVNMRLKYSGCC